MEYADFLLTWAENILSEKKKLQFKEDDIRVDFLNLLHGIAMNYYRGYIGYEISKLSLKGKVAFKNVHGIDKHIRHYMQTSMHDISDKSHRYSQNRHLLIDGWSNFELCVTTLVEGLATPQEKERLLRHQHHEIEKLLNNYNISDKHNKKLFSKIGKTHLTHVPITVKTDYLFTKAKNYYSNIPKDKEFLKFLGKLRNTIHTNFIYHGKNYEYKFGHAHFIFEDGKIVKWIDPFENSPELYFHIFGKLKDIWIILINTIKHDEPIAYPDLDQE